MRGLWYTPVYGRKQLTYPHGIARYTRSMPYGEKSLRVVMITGNDDSLLDTDPLVSLFLSLPRFTPLSSFLSLGAFAKSNVSQILRTLRYLVGPKEAIY